MVIWNLLTIFAALIGGVGAVMIGQVLSLYRDDIDAARQVRYQLNYIQLLTKGELSISEMERTSQKMKDGIENISQENMWLFSEEGEKLLLRIIHDLNKIEYAASEADTENLDNNIDSISQKCKAMDSEIAYVTFRGALRRFLGDERPYSNYSK